jgi:hypothetical protein
MLIHNVLCLIVLKIVIVVWYLTPIFFVVNVDRHVHRPSGRDIVRTVDKWRRRDCSFDVKEFFKSPLLECRVNVLANG